MLTSRANKNCPHTAFHAGTNGAQVRATVTVIFQLFCYFYKCFTKLSDSSLRASSPLPPPPPPRTPLT